MIDLETFTDTGPFSVCYHDGPLDHLPDDFFGPAADKLMTGDLVVVVSEPHEGQARASAAMFVVTVADGTVLAEPVQLVPLVRPRQES